jgi:hypothetical protein
MYEGSVMFNLYAVKPNETPATNPSLREQNHPATFEQLLDRAKKYGDALNRQRQLIGQRRKEK